MGSPIKKKLKDGVEQQILTNYYLNRYDKVMSKLADKKVETIFSSSKSKNQRMHQPNRKNFKELILERKAQKNSNMYASEHSTKKNFKSEIDRKNSIEKAQKQNRKNFYKLEDTIVQQLYKPSPSQLERQKYQQIEVIHKISYQDRIQKIEPFRFTQQEEDQNVDIRVDSSEQHEVYEVSIDKLQHNQISEAIRSTFEKRSPKKNQSQSPHRNQKSISKSPTNKIPPKPPILSMLNQEPYFFENIRPQFQEKFGYDSKKFGEQSTEKYNNNKTSEKVDSEPGNKSERSMSSRDRSFEKISFHQGKVSRKNSLIKSINNERKRNQSFQDDSFHQNIPQIEQQPKISPEKQKSQKVSQKISDQHSEIKSESKSLKSSRVHNSSNHKDSVMHEFSMMSRFSMTSDEGHLIKDELVRQLNENEFGPYQNALTSFLDLIDEHPHAWPIFVVGQRILDDRHQYEIKRAGQQSQISRLQTSIQSLKRTKNRRSEVQQNQFTIMGLVRQLSHLLSDEQRS